MRKAKDVRAERNAPPPRELKKSGAVLPKILEVAEHTGSLHAQRVRCGKANCKCARGQLHEGYYFFWSNSAGAFKRYVRRTDVPTVRAVIERRKQRVAAFRSELRQAHAELWRLLKSLR